MSSAVLTTTTPRGGGRWIDHWLESVRDLESLRAAPPMMDAVIEEIDGRMIRVGEQWLGDFASCNYLGFDLDPEIIAAVPGYLEEWGTHPSWSRLLGSPALYEQIESRLTTLLGFEDPEHLDELLSADHDRARMVCMDGVNSMTGNPPDLKAFAEVSRRHGALLYVDDAHGFGGRGERSGGEGS